MSTPTEAVRNNARWGWLLFPFGLAVAGMAVLGGGRAHLYGFVACAFAAGVVLLGIWRWGRLSTAQVLGGAVVLRLLVFWLPPGLSDDAFRYVWDGLLQTQGINPFLYTPDELTALRIDPRLYRELNSASFYSVYPPVSQFVFLAGAWIGGEYWLEVYYVIKLLLVAAELGGLFVLSRLTDARALLLYAWHPLVIVETAGQAHTEALAVLFLVLTVYLAGRRQGRWASVTLALAGWVKLYPFVLFPLLWRRFGWKAVWPGMLASIIVVAPYYHPDVPGNLAASLDLYVRYFEFNAGLYYGVKEVFLWITGGDVSKTLGPVFRAFFLLSLPVFYAVDARRRWSLRRSFVWILGAFFLLATTVHPWYVLGLLALAAPASRPSWHWHWLGLLSIGTYLLYAGGLYWPFVILGWGGWLVLAVIRYYRPALRWIQRRRARRKVERIKPFLPSSDADLRILDLGTAEGYVGRMLQEERGADVVLADIVDLNRTALPLVLYDGRRLPFGAEAFDVTVLYFVLHHCEAPEHVIREALRVTRQRVIVVESVYRSRIGKRWLEVADRVVNRIRSRGAMRSQEEHLHFRTAAAWKHLFEQQPEATFEMHEFGGLLHRQALFVLGKN